MSKSNVEELESRLTSGAIPADAVSKDSTPADLIKLGSGNGLAFTEDDLSSFLRLRIANAESLPRPWGWAVARQLGLVRS
ncbi:MAG: hypothetical protein HOH04_08400 [Rhodospirillaceae bacterium]|jgi:hypothetical protein|nr:hypothetical protein [Rhodospirillaceae bacterium]